ncbi:uncharacterized protein PpBr36_10542 [Pyricularia pennisetigena]|uniref:uncharacterized protein n=1 Tax=Pyricularia pennisetigena TaxID=1578925 RepID=UPI00114F99E7|nr:uncharacterized protein PpBr36_10542 [Pyricularia pennisetigena]TLS21262.1 hypothetical protein PpBr36_10542 [Pyricularia pennisetigena]
MMVYHLGSVLCAAAAVMSTPTAQTVVAHDCYSKLVPDIEPHEISLVVPLANVIATDGPSSTRQWNGDATARINILSEIPVAVVRPTSPAASTNSMAVCRPVAPKRACNITVDGPNAKPNNAHTHVPKPAHKLTRYDSAAFAGASALIGAALLF